MMSTMRREARRTLQRRVARAYHLAAVAYALYGVVYFVGAVVALTPERQVSWLGIVPWWAFYAVGLVLLLLLPVLIWRQWQWLCRILALGPASKALVLFWRQGRLLANGEPPGLFNWLFAVVAIAAALLLARASWPAKTPEADQDPPAYL